MRPKWLTYQQLEEGGWIKSKLLDFLDDAKWEEAKERVKEKERCVIFIPEVSRSDHVYYNQRYKDELPVEIHFKDGFGQLPIHTAALRGAPLSLIKKIYRRYPEALSIQSAEISNGYYPLHIICRPEQRKDEFMAQQGNLSDERRTLSAERLDAVHWMMKKYPQALVKQDAEGKATPLHIILEHKPPFYIVKEMIDSAHEHGNILSMRDVEWQVPLHTALDYGDYGAASLISELLINKYPNAATLKMEKGYLPLHFAAKSGCSRAVLELLLKHNPLGVAVTADNGDHPLHLIFDHYLKKYDETGKSLFVNHASAQEMINIMLSEYYKAVVQQRGDKRAKLSIKKLIDKHGSDGRSIYTYAKTRVPANTLSYLEKLSKGRGNVKLVNLPSRQVEEQDGEESETKTSGIESTRTTNSISTTKSTRATNSTTATSSTSSTRPPRFELNELPTCSESRSVAQKKSTPKKSQKRSRLKKPESRDESNIENESNAESGRSYPQWKRARKLSSNAFTEKVVSNEDNLNTNECSNVDSVLSSDFIGSSRTEINHDPNSTSTRESRNHKKSREKPTMMNDDDVSQNPIPDAAPKSQNKQEVRHKTNFKNGRSSNKGDSGCSTDSDQKGRAEIQIKKEQDFDEFLDDIVTI